MDGASESAVCLVTDRATLLQAGVLARSLSAIFAPLGVAVIIVRSRDAIDPTFDAWIETASPHTDVITVDVRKLLPRSIKKPGHLPLVTFCRLLLPEILPERYSRVLYLDTDIVVTDRIARLFELDLGGAPFAAVEESVVARPEIVGNKVPENQLAYRRNLGLGDGTPYLNSGVLLMDMKRWTKAQLGRRALRFYADNLALCPSLDQSCLNATVRGEFALLSPIWNYQTPWFEFGLEKVLDPAVLHFNGPEKPWKELTWRHDIAYANHFRRAFEDTPWRDLIRSLWTPDDLTSYLARNLDIRRREECGLPPLSGSLPGFDIEHRELFVRQLMSAPFADVRQGIVELPEIDLAAIPYKPVLSNGPAAAPGPRGFLSYLASRPQSIARLGPKLVKRMRKMRNARQ